MVRRGEPKLLLVAAVALLMVSTILADAVDGARARRLDEKRYKFVWPECSFEDHELTGQECKDLIEQDLQYNVIPDVQVQLIKNNEREPQMNEVGIRVNSRDQVIGKSNDGIVSYRFQWDGHPIGPWPCAGKRFMQCCRMIQRRTSKNEDDATIGCYREESLPKATVHKGLEDDVSYTEYLYNEATEEIELTFVERTEDMIVYVQEGADGKVHELPYLDAQLSLNPADEITAFFADSAVGGSSNTNVMSMSVAGDRSSGASVFAQGMGDTWWYGIPLGIAIFSACSCCAFVFYMCCIPVKDEDLMAPEKFTEPEGVEEMGQQSKAL